MGLHNGRMPGLGRMLAPLVAGLALWALLGLVVVVVYLARLAMGLPGFPPAR